MESLNTQEMIEIRGGFAWADFVEGVIYAAAVLGLY